MSATLKQLTAASDALGAVLADLPECPARNHAEAHLRTTLHHARSALDSQRYVDEMAESVKQHQYTIASQEAALANHQDTIATHEQTIEDLRAELLSKSGPVE